MPVSGLGHRRVLILAEGPGYKEDEQGIQLVGLSGQKLAELLDKIDVSLRRDCWLDNAIRCRKTDANGDNLEPKDKEIGHCRANLVATLRDYKPEVVIPLGKAGIKAIVALGWKEGEVDTMGQWAGWTIPCAELNCWICPAYHTSYLMRQKSVALELLMLRHLRKAFSLNRRPWPVQPNWERYVRVEMDPEKAARDIQVMACSGRPLAFDYETTTLKPDGPDAEILCYSVSDGQTSISCPFAGPTAEVLKSLLLSDVPKIACNLKFEQRWTQKHLKVAVRNWMWDCLLGAHWLNCKRGICGLDFQAFALLGVGNYSSYLDPYMQGEGGNGVNKLRQVEPRLLYKYNALDSLFEWNVAMMQMGKISFENWRDYVCYGKLAPCHRL